MGENPVQLLMLVAGIGILCWIMLRNRMLRQRRSQPVVIPRSLKHNANARRQFDQFTGTQSLGAPTEVLQWQVEMHELGRQIQAELESKMLAVQTLIRQQEQATAQLHALLQQTQQLQAASQDSCLFSRIVQLAQQGWTPPKIARFLSVTPQDVLSVLQVDANRDGAGKVAVRPAERPVRSR